MVDEGFRNLMETHWHGNEADFLVSLQTFAVAAIEWNKKTFGSILWRKKKYMVRLVGIQKSVEKGPSNFLANLEEELLIEYGNILKQEEMFLFQKSKAKWLLEGERNTQSFHLSVVIK